MAYKVIILYQLYMPSYFLGTFTEYPSYSPDLHKTVHRCPGICEPSVYRLGRLIKGGNGVVLCKSDIKSEYVENTMMQELPEFFQRTVFQNFHRILGDG